MEIQRIKSFEIDHDILMPGFYISRVDGDIITYDMRTRRPNMGDYMSDLTMHSVEHMFATYIRNSEIASSVVYFGPMGCRTGFYFLVRNLSHQQALDLIKETVKKCSEHVGEIPGTTAIECGNYKEHDKNGAVSALKKYYSLLKDYKIDNLEYN